VYGAGGSVVVGCTGSVVVGCTGSVVVGCTFAFCSLVKENSHTPAESNSAV